VRSLVNEQATSHATPQLRAIRRKAAKPIRISLRSWKDADADIPILIEAKQEYEKLK